MSPAASPLDRSIPPATGPTRSFRLPAFERSRLGPGVDLLVAPLERTSMVHLEVVTPASAAWDPVELPGLAAMTASMLDEGSSKRNAFEIAAGVERLGGQLSTGTGWNSTTLVFDALAQHLRSGLSLLAEVLGDPVFPEGELERLRSRTLSELQRRRSLPASLAARQYAHALYGDGLYGHPILGTEESVTAITREDVDRFYRSHVLAAPATVIASGALDPSDLLTDARELVACLTGDPLGSGQSVEPRLAEGPRVFVVDRPEATQTELRIGHVGVARAHPDATALTVLNSVLGGKFTSRLMLSLRERLGLTYSVRSSFARRLDRGPFTIAAAVETAGAGEAVRESLIELERMRDEEISDSELADAQNFILGVFPYTVQTIAGVAHRLREIAVHGLGDDHWDRYPEMIRDVTVGDVRRVAGEHLRPSEIVVVAVGPAEQLTTQLEPFGTLDTWRPADRDRPL